MDLGVQAGSIGKMPQPAFRHLTAGTVMGAQDQDSQRTTPEARSALLAAGAQTSTAPASTVSSADTTSGKYFRRSHSATVTSPIRTGTSTKGPTTAAKATPEPRPKTVIATARANSKLLLAAVNARAVVFE